jgi:DNA polymerase-3 subunit delta
MRIHPTQLSQHLQKQLLPFYTVYGEESLLAIEAADMIRSKARQTGYVEREIFTIDNQFSGSDLRLSSNGLSLFGERRVMDLRIPSGKPGKEGGMAIEEYCRLLPSDTVTLVTLPGIDKQGQATKWFKTLENIGPMISVSLIERNQLPGWIGQRLSIQNQRTDPDTLQFFAEKVEGNLLAANQEIRKLALLYPPGTLSFTQVKDAVLEVARYDVFKLSDAMVTGDIARYTLVLKGLQGEGEPELRILPILAAQIRSLIILRKGLDSGRPLTQLMKEAKVWRNRQKVMESAARKIGLKLLVHALLHAAKIDKICKGVATGDTWDEFLQLGLRFAFNKR